MAVIEKKVVKRTFSGKDNTNIIHSEYCKSLKWAVVALIGTNNKTVGGVAYASCRTRKEAEELNLDYPNHGMTDLKTVKKKYNQLIK